MMNILKKIFKRTKNILFYLACGNLFKRKKIEERRRMEFWKERTEDIKRTIFYGQFIKEGDLVFDIGANMGERAKVFVNLGATVVGVEPQPICIDFLKIMFKKKKGFNWSARLSVQNLVMLRCISAIFQYYQQCRGTGLMRCRKVDVSRNLM